MPLCPCVRLLFSAPLLSVTALGLLPSGAFAQVLENTAQPTHSGDSAQAGPASVTPPEQPATSSADDIVVTGQVYAVEKAVEAKRRRGIVSDTISASEIGAIPDFGLGEALQRIPGASLPINNGRGEAQFLTLRGLNADYNSVTLDGILLPSTEETRRQVSFDVLPSIIANQVSVYKTYTADQPSDAIGGVTNLTTHSAFDHPGFFVAGHLDYAYWERRRRFADNPPSGQGDLRVSQTFGPNDEFGAIVLVSYYARVSNSLNSYSLPYSYYPYAGTPGTVMATRLTPTTSIDGLLPIPNRRRWYFYDNIRQRPGGYAKLEFDNHDRFFAHASAGYFEHLNDESRYSSYVNVGATTATFTTADQASFATGQAETDFDRLCCRTDGGDSAKESRGIDGRDAQACRPSLPYDELARV